MQPDGGDAFATRPVRGNTFGATIMTNDNQTDDRFAMRPIDIELYETCAKGTLAQVKALLDKGADPNAPHWVKPWPEDLDSEIYTEDYYCVHEAARNPDIRVFDLLVERGANPRQKDYWGSEPLAFAAHSNGLEMVKHLVELGNDPDLCNIDGQTVIGNAALHPDIHVVEFLLASGATLDNGDLYHTELARALQNGTPDRVRFFVEHGSNLEFLSTESFREAPLENIRALLECGLDPDFEDEFDEGRLVDLLDDDRRALFLEFGAKPLAKQPCGEQ